MWHFVAQCGAVWRAGRRGEPQRRGGRGENLCLGSGTVGNFRELSRPSPPPSPTAGWVYARGGGAGGRGRGSGRVARIVPLPIGRVVRAGDGFSGEIAVFRGISRVFLTAGGCAVRVMGAHQVARIRGRARE